MGLEATLSAACLLVAFSPSVLAEQPRLRFVQWNDTHVDSKDADYRLANEKMDCLVSSLNAETYFPVPDFVIGIGDLITGEGSGIPKFEADYAMIKTKLARLKCPFYPVVGNHEVCQQEGNAEFEAPYTATFGTGRVNYTFEAGGILFVVFNDSGAPGSNKSEVGQARRNWLRGVLEASPNVPKILCCHIPLIPMREEPVLRESFHWNSPWAQDDEMLKLVDAHSDEIVAVLTAHLHLTGAVQRNGIWHVVTSGSASYPHDFAYYQVFGDRIHVEMFSLPAELQTPDTDTHGKTCPLHKIDYTDNAHLTHETYLKGSAAERVFDIPMKPKK